MSKRNFILLAITLSVVIVAVLGFLFFSGGLAPTEGGNGTGTNFFSQFNPFGPSTTKPPVTTPPVEIPEENPPVVETTPSKLTKVSSMPIAGFILYTKERLKEVIPPVIPPTTDETVKKTVKKPVAPLTEFISAVRYAARENGNIYETFADAVREQKFSKTVIPQVYDAYFGSKGESVVMRHLKIDNVTIETFAGTLPKELLGTIVDGNAEIKGSFLPDNIKDISISPDTSKAFYLFDSGDSMVGTTLNFGDNKKVQIFDSPFIEWLSQWSTSNTITLSTKPSNGIPGYMYSLDATKKTLIKTFGDVGGLTTLESPNGKLVLYADSNLSLNIYHTDTGSSEALGIKTLPEKCTWGSVSDVVYCAVPKSVDIGNYPDAWYKGALSFNDEIWKINIKDLNTTIEADANTNAQGQEIDGIKLSLDPKENYLFFVNKKDSYLWKLDLK